jgi:hypothetical protein
MEETKKSMFLWWEEGRSVYVCKCVSGHVCVYDLCLKEAVCVGAVWSTYHSLTVVGWAMCDGHVIGLNFNSGGFFASKTCIIIIFLFFSFL